MTHCRIGKITDNRTGNTIQRFPDKNLTTYTSDVQFNALKTANEHVRNGTAKMVGVVMILDDGTVFHDFQKRDTVTSIQVLGAIDMFHHYAMSWAKS